MLATPINPWLIVRDRAWHRMRKGNCSMSFLVELDRGAYPDNALAAFVPTSQFGLDNARAMMWLSQLAYETGDRPKVESILAAGI
jgi:hypothetical protein